LFGNFTYIEEINVIVTIIL